MNEVNVAGLNAVEEAMRDEAIEPKIMPKRFERRNTVALPPSAYGAHSLPPIDAIIAAHESSHGDFTGNATTAQGLKSVMRQGKNWEEMPAWMRESLEQMQTKVAKNSGWRLQRPRPLEGPAGLSAAVETRLETK